mmetsp:Transcript_77799/g.231744  ORF Transcript_77799/g.231744 Transcript_77799/m.231744 type:complete len:359 (-) Transcript_77799:248-1324(-)
MQLHEPFPLTAHVLDAGDLLLCLVPLHLPQPHPAVELHLHLHIVRILPDRLCGGRLLLTLLGLGLLLLLLPGCPASGGACGVPCWRRPGLRAGSPGCDRWRALCFGAMRSALRGVKRLVHLSGMPVLSAVARRGLLVSSWEAWGSLRRRACTPRRGAGRAHCKPRGGRLPRAPEVARGRHRSPRAVRRGLHARRAAPLDRRFPTIPSWIIGPRSHARVPSRLRAWIHLPIKGSRRPLRKGTRHCREVRWSGWRLVCIPPRIAAHACPRVRSWGQPVHPWRTPPIVRVVHGTAPVLRRRYAHGPAPVLWGLHGRCQARVILGDLVGLPRIPVTALALAVPPPLPAAAAAPVTPGPPVVF